MSCLFWTFSYRIFLYLAPPTSVLKKRVVEPGVCSLSMGVRYHTMVRVLSLYVVLVRVVVVPAGEAWCIMYCVPDSAVVRERGTLKVRGPQKVSVCAPCCQHWPHALTTSPKFTLVGVSDLCLVCVNTQSNISKDFVSMCHSGITQSFILTKWIISLTWTYSEVLLNCYYTVSWGNSSCSNHQYANNKPTAETSGSEAQGLGFLLHLCHHFKTTAFFSS